MKNFMNFRKLVMILVDLVLLGVSYLNADILINNFNSPGMAFFNMANFSSLILLVYIVVFYLMDLYSKIWLYASLEDISKIFFANILSLFIIIPLSIIFNSPYSVNMYIVAGVFMFLFSGSFRFSFRMISRYVRTKGASKDDMKRVLIIGAGSVGAILVREMKSNNRINYLPVAFVDDDHSKIGNNISNIKVVSDRYGIPSFVKELSIDVIVLAINHIDGDNKRAILDICKDTDCDILVMPNFLGVFTDRINLENLRKVNIEDLLGRDCVSLDKSRIGEYIAGKVVMVTGGAGSIGSQLCRDILEFRPKELVVLDTYENGIFTVGHEFSRLKPGIKISYAVASIRDKLKLDLVFKKYRPEVVFHAAALKHVPLMEHNPGEAIKTNVFGTINLAKVADKYDVKKFVMISTDKAVNPVNIMGATKRICEIYLEAFNDLSSTEFVAVRFGNVLGSAGSVVPLFTDQIKAGLPITVTHRDITRYFMTIPEASELVLQAAAYANGGEIFVLDMGSPVRIYDLAIDLIRLSGLRPHQDVEIVITGLRPGEKLYEELLRGDEDLLETQHEKIFVSRPFHYDFDVLCNKIEAFIPLLVDEDKESLVRQIELLVASYVRFEDIDYDVGN